MHVVKGEEQLLDQVRCLAFTKPLHLDDVIIELSTGHQLRHYVKIDIVLQKFKNAHDMWMICLLEHIKLLLHQVKEDLMLSDLLLIDDFHGTGHVSLSIVALSHLAEGALAEDAANSVPALDIGRALQGFKKSKLQHFLALAHYGST